jgi:hypothetical protein
LSFTGGYDVCVELTDDLLSLGGFVKLFGTAQRPLSNQFPAAPFLMGAGSVKLIAVGLGVRAIGGGLVDVTILVNGSGITLGSASLGGLDGFLTLRGVPFRLSPVRLVTENIGRTSQTRMRNVQDLVLDMQNLTRAELSWNAASSEQFERFAQQQGRSPAQLLATISDALRMWIGVLYRQVVLITLKLALPGLEGFLKDQTFIRYDATTLAASSGRPGVACLFGRLLREHQDGDPGKKNQIASPLGEAGAIVLSPLAVHDYAFCRGATRAFLAGSLARQVPDDFLHGLPGDALQSVDASGVALSTDAERAGADAIARNDREAFFDAVLPRPLPPNITSGLPAKVVTALPAAVATGLEDIAAIEIDLLPLPCGEGEPLLGGGDAQVELLNASLQDGGLRLAGRATPTADYLDGDVTFSAELLLTLSSNGQRVNVTLDPSSVRIDSEVHIAWWAYVLFGLVAIGGAVFGGPVGVGVAIGSTAALATIAGLTGLVMEKVVEKTAKGISDAIADASVDFVAPLFTSATRVETRRDGVIVHLAPNAMRRALSVPSVGIGQTATRTETDSPPQMTRIDDMCHSGVYSYVQRMFTEVVTLQAIASDFTPARYLWTLEGNPLTGSTGQFGSSPSLLDWRIADGGKTLTLTNHPGGPLFSVGVSLTATDGGDLQATAATTLFFEGQEIRYDDRYNNETRQCIENLRNQITAQGPLPGSPPLPDLPMPPEPPRPPIGDLIDGILASGQPLDARTLGDLATLFSTAGVDPSSILPTPPLPVSEPNPDAPRRPGRFP